MMAKKKYRWQKYVARDITKNDSHHFQQRLSRLLAAAEAVYRETDELENSPAGQAMRRRCQPSRNGGRLPIDDLLKLTTVELRKLDQGAAAAPVSDRDVSIFISRMGQLIKRQAGAINDIAAELKKRLSFLQKNKERRREIAAVKQTLVSFESRWKSGCDRLSKVTYKHIELALWPLLPPARSE